MVATPGRLSEMLNKEKLNLDLCKYIVLDEAERMLEQTFELEIKNILSKCTSPSKQTMLFSSTMPQRIQQFTKSLLQNPIIINVGRSGAANLDVLQEVEYVK